jgi:ribosomal VAR1-like protein
MLNIFKSKLDKEIMVKEQMKNSNKKIYGKNKNEYKYFPSSIREWNNSIYTFNKNTLNFIPQATIIAIKIIKSYFNLYNYKIEHKLRKDKLARRLRRLSSNKIYLSNGEFKHTNNRVTIILYVYNRQKYNYIKKIESSYKRAFKSNIKNINKKFKLIQLKSKNSLEITTKINSIFVNILGKEKYILNIFTISNYINNFYNKLVSKSLKKLKLYLYYKQLIYINKSKFNYTFLQYLKKYLEKIYNKNIEFIFINLRHFYLNSDILTETLILKIRKNRRKLLKHLKNIKRKVKIYKGINFYKKPNIIINKYINKKLIKNFILRTIKHKYITGFKLEASGRLTKRYTASRSLSKLIQKGNLLNIDSSYRGLSSAVLKGNLRSNLQYTKSKSKTRIGSFGIKGWISSN